MAYNGLYKTAAYTTTGTMPSLNTDAMIVPFNATVAVNVGGGGTYGMQYSLSPVANADGTPIPDANAIWFNSTNMPTGTAASMTTAIIAPVARIRLVIASISDTITLQVQQGMSTN
jgi:hypothetical protein